MMKLYTVLLLIYASALAHSSVESPRTRAPLDQPNILLIVLDDVGIDRFPGYGVHPVPMRMPVMERLINRGIRFNRVWSMPNCSPTRASLLTGRFPSRHGVYRAVSPDDDDAVELDTAEVTLPRVLPGYRSSAVGKWHLKAPNTSGVHPLLCGFGHHAGSLYNVGGGGYSNWERTVDGTPGMENRYASTVASTDALRLAQQLLPEPWLLYVSYNAAHAPFHVPPQHLHSYGNPTDKITRFRAMCEAMDTEIGRLLAGVDLDNTLVIVLGDNGTPGQVSTGPWPADHAKGSLYEGGVRVPMVIAGPGVVHGTSQALISVTDLHRTLVEYTGGHYQA
ncbi:MAG: arylsulfatase A-like enzyme, partial [Planctomycetota bacterium]